MPVASAQAASVYVSDQIPVMVRRGKATSFAILAQVRGGEAVELLGEEDGYSRIRTADGIEGWVVSRYLTRAASAREQLSAAEARVAELESAYETLTARIAELEARPAVAEAAPPAIEVATVADAAPADVPAEAAAAPVPGADFSELKGQLDGIEDAVASIAAPDATPQARRDFMILGAGLLAAGLILGLLLPHLGRRGGNDW